MLPFLISLIVLGAHFQPSGPSTLSKASGVEFSIFRKLRVGSREIPLKGWGIREKSVGPFSVNVYAAKYYAGTTGYPKALQMVFLRDIDQEKIRSAYTESLATNGVEISGKLAALLNRVSLDVAKADAVTLVAGSADQVIVSDKHGSEAFEQKGLAENFFKIWLGKPNDTGLEELKKKLSGGS